jgi:hypothetical protein
MLLQLVDTLRSTDWVTLGILAATCGIASLFLKDYLALPPTIIFIYPFLILFSLLAYHSFIYFEVYPTTKLDQWLLWTILSGISGILVGTILIGTYSALRYR